MTEIRRRQSRRSLRELADLQAWGRDDLSLLPVLEAIEEGDVLVKLISPLRPGLIEAADESRFQYLIMPIRLNV